jgi:hypothetical protein
MYGVQPQAYTFKVFLHGALVGEVVEDWFFRHHWWAPLNKHFFCPVCGETWARWVRENSAHEVNTQLCKRCEGSETFNRTLHHEHVQLSRSLLEREVFILAEIPDLYRRYTKW